MSTTSIDGAATAYGALAATLRGSLIRPEDPG
jgi:hypothetical protein